MNIPDYRALEAQLARQSYESVGNELRPLSSAVLLAMLDSKSTKVGDTAAGVLERRKEAGLLVDALLQNRLRTAMGRIRATNILNAFGRHEPIATEACLHCLDDRSDRVLSNALFGIVFMRRRDLLPELQERTRALRCGTVRHEQLRQAIEALQNNDPLLFAPGFEDTTNAWRLEEPPSKGW